MKVVWNSSGGKWDDLIKNFTTPLLPKGDVLAYNVEAGWAPWVQSGDVVINGWYACENFTTYFNFQKLAVWLRIQKHIYY